MKQIDCCFLLLLLLLLLLLRFRDEDSLRTIGPSKPEVALNRLLKLSPR
jgi:hypothetical protein